MFRFDKLSAGRFYTAPSVERVVEFSPPDIEVENISKVLSLAVEGRCTSANACDGYAEIEGRASFKLVYLDREGNPNGVEYNADFSVNAEGEFDVNDTLSCTVKVVEADVNADGNLTLSAVLDVTVQSISREEFDALVDAEKCYKTQKDVSVPLFVASKTVTVPVEDDVRTGQVDAVLAVDTRCAIKSTSAEENTVKIAATVYSTVTYIEGGLVKEQLFEIAVEEELNIDGVQSGDGVCAESCVRSSKIVLEGVTDDNVIRLESEVQFKAQVFRKADTAVVDDLFMLTHEVDAVRTRSSYTAFEKYGYYTERVSGTALLNENRAAAREIAALPYARCYTSKAFTDENGLTVEGIVNTDIVYVDENGYNSVRTELPFSVVIRGEFAEDIKANCVVETIGARIRRDREIEVDLVLGVGVCEFDKTECEYISAIELGEEKEQNTSALSLYIADEGDEMWDVCKALTATPEEILAQNPTMQTPLGDGERIIFFRAM